jgi:hypothetical protein
MSRKQTERPVQPAWRRASFCASTECVEVAEQDGVIMVRDSAHPSGGTVQWTVEAWRTFVRAIRADSTLSLSEPNPASRCPFLRVSIAEAGQCRGRQLGNL